METSTKDSSVTLPVVLQRSAAAPPPQCWGSIAKWVNSSAYEKSTRRLCPLNPLYYTPLSSSLVKLLLLQIAMGIDFVYWSGLSSSVRCLCPPCCVQTEDEVDAHRFFVKDPSIFLASSFLMWRLKTSRKLEHSFQSKLIIIQSKPFLKTKPTKRRASECLMPFFFQLTHAFHLHFLSVSC